MYWVPFQKLIHDLLIQKVKIKVINFLNIKGFQDFNSLYKIKELFLTILSENVAIQKVHQDFYYIIKISYLPI